MFRFALILYLSLIPFVAIAQETKVFSEKTIPGPWSLPVGIEFDGEGQAYIWDMLGKVFIMNASGEVLAKPLLDISEEVSKWLDQGMVGFALDPNFSANGYFYVMYPVDPHYWKNIGTSNYNPQETATHTATFGRICRYTADKAQNFQEIIPDSRKIILGSGPEDGFPILFDSHGLGALVFGNDGTLLASCGDGANSVWIDTGSNGGSYYAEGLQDGIIQEKENIGAFRAQYLSSLNGKIIRIDPETGSGLSSNPFYDPAAPKSAASRVWTLGLRNPFRFIVIPETGSHLPADGQPGTLICGDVGENTWEELIAITSGGENAGWPIYEGFEKSPTYGVAQVLFPDNELYNDCGADPIRFDQLLFEDQLHPAKPEYPCDLNSKWPEALPYFYHLRPMLVYQNQEASQQTKAFAAVPSFDETGQAIALSIEDEAAQITGAPFQGDASMAGFYYKDGALPEQYHNRFFQMDYFGWIRTYQLDENVKIQATEPFFEGGDRIVAAAPAPNEAAIYFISLADRRLHKLSYGGKRPPKASLRVNQTYGQSPLTIEFDASQSQGFESSLTYEWDFGDGTKASTAKISKTFTSQELKNLTVELSVRDSFGGTDEVQETIFLNNTPPEISWESPNDREYYPLSSTNLLRLEAIASDQETADDALDYSWEIFLHHNSHSHPSNVKQGAKSFALLSPLGCGLETYWYRILLTVTDAEGLSTQLARDYFPNCQNGLTKPEFNLTAVANDYKVALDWDFSLEAEVDYYEIERGQDYFNFDWIGHSSSAQFEDNVSKLGTYIYRVKALTADGRFWYSNFIERSLPLAQSYQLFPNPNNGEALLELNDFKGNYFEITLLNTWGQTVYHKKVNRLPEGNIGYPLRFAGLNAGTYFYTIKTADNHLAGKLIIR
jgi:hypothetical protein